jgi:hypothetical protein
MPDDKHTLPDPTHQLLRQILDNFGAQPIFNSLIALADERQQEAIKGHEDLPDIQHAKKVEDSINTMEMLFERINRMNPSPFR